VYPVTTDVCTGGGLCLLGHIPMFLNPEFADTVQAIGQASLGAPDDDIWHLVKVRPGRCCPPRHQMHVNPQRYYTNLLLMACSGIIDGSGISPLPARCTSPVYLIQRMIDMFR